MIDRVKVAQVRNAHVTAQTIVTQLSELDPAPAEVFLGGSL